MIPFDGDLRLNSAMIPVRSGASKNSRKEYVSRLKKGELSNCATDICCLSASTSLFLLMTILSSMFIVSTASLRGTKQSLCYRFDVSIVLSRDCFAIARNDVLILSNYIFTKCPETLPFAPFTGLPLANQFCIISLPYSVSMLSG